MTPAFFVQLPVAASVGGGKAASLGVLADFKLVVPRGFVCTDALFRHWVGQALGSQVCDTDDDLLQLRSFMADAAFPNGFAEELSEALRALGAESFSVRSSFALEDEVDALAAGVFESVLKVKAGDVLQAIRKVLLSALSPSAVAYVRARGRHVLDGPMGVLVHGFVAGTAHGHVAATDVSASTWVSKGQLSADVMAELKRTALTVAKRHGPSELEWVCEFGQLTFLQWRPYAPAPPALPWQPSQEESNQSVAAPAAPWSWDAAHNPAPLSPAQQGLVALVNERCNVGYDQRVVGGYLFYRKNPARLPMAVAAGDVDKCYLQLQSEVLASLACLAHPPALQAALTVFVNHYEELVGVLGGAVRAGKQQLSAFVEQNAAGLLPGVAEFLAHQTSKATERIVAFGRVADAHDKAAAWNAYVNAFGDEPVAWDVMSATQRELPMPADTGVALEPAVAVLRAAQDALQKKIVDQIDPALRVQLDQCLHVAIRCSVRGEDDDWLYARLQAPVRFACKAVGRDMVTQGLLDNEDDVFFLPLNLVSQLAAMPASSALPLREMVCKAKALFNEQIHNPPPMANANGAAALRGHGTAGRVVGRVRIYQPGQRFADIQSVLVSKSLLPTELPLIRAAAFVVETGGPLDHVAAQARERRLPAIVGVANATTLLREGDLVLVDADAGVVVRLQRDPSE